MNAGDIAIGVVVGAGGAYLVHRWLRKQEAPTNAPPGGGAIAGGGLTAANSGATQATAATEMTQAGAHSSTLGGTPATASLGKAPIATRALVATETVGDAKQNYGRALQKAVALNFKPRPQLPVPSTDVASGGPGGVIVNGTTAAGGAN